MTPLQFAVSIPAPVIQPSLVLLLLGSRFHVESLCQLSTSSDVPTPSTTTHPTVQAPYSQTLVTQWMVLPVSGWLQSKGFDGEIQRAFHKNNITPNDLIELDGPAPKDELGVAAFGKRMRLLRQIGELKREKEKVKEMEREMEKGCSEDWLEMRWIVETCERDWVRRGPAQGSAYWDPPNLARSFAQRLYPRNMRLLGFGPSQRRPRYAQRDPVQPSCNVPIIPLAIAQRMNPAPRPPSLSEQEAAQRTSRHENPN